MYCVQHSTKLFEFKSRQKCQKYRPLMENRPCAIQRTELRIPQTSINISRGA